MCLLITQNKRITIGNTSFKITQFDDDTTLIIDGSESSLVVTLNTLEIFATVSGLKMNTSKSKMTGWKEEILQGKNKIYGASRLEFGGLQSIVFRFQCKLESNA